MPKNPIVIIVAGGRHYDDEAAALLMVTATQEWRDEKQPGRALLLKHGAASGADKLVDKTVIMRWDFTMPYRALWEKQGRAAGPLRNQRMIDSGAHAVFAFPGGTGTADCVSRAEAAGIPVLQVSDVWHPDQVHAFLDEAITEEKA